MSNWPLHVQPHDCNSIGELDQLSKAIKKNFKIECFLTIDWN